jgi:hypothetical protein
MSNAVEARRTQRKTGEAQRKGRKQAQRTPREQQQDFFVNPGALVPWWNVRSGCFSLAKKPA